MNCDDDDERWTAGADADADLDEDEDDKENRAPPSRAFCWSAFDSALEREQAIAALFDSDDDGLLARLIRGQLGESDIWCLYAACGEALEVHLGEQASDECDELKGIESGEPSDRVGLALATLGLIACFAPQTRASGASLADGQDADADSVSGTARAEPDFARADAAFVRALEHGSRRGRLYGSVGHMHVLLSQDNPANRDLTQSERLERQLSALACLEAVAELDDRVWPMAGGLAEDVGDLERAKFYYARAAEAGYEESGDALDLLGVSAAMGGFGL